MHGLDLERLGSGQKQGIRQHKLLIRIPSRGFALIATWVEMTHRTPTMIIAAVSAIIVVGAGHILKTLGIGGGSAIAVGIEVIKSITMMPMGTE